MHNSRDNIEQEPRAAKDDRLHGIKADKAVSLLQDIKNDAADQWNAGDGCSHIRRQTGRLGFRAGLGFGTWRWWRWRRWLVRVNWVGHGLHTQIWRYFVKESSASLLRFWLSYLEQDHYRGVLAVQLND